MNEVYNMPNECVPDRVMNIKEKMLTLEEMQLKAIEILSATKRDVMGGEKNKEGPAPIETCMDSVASQNINRMAYILELLGEIKDALGVDV